MKANLSIGVMALLFLSMGAGVPGLCARTGDPGWPREYKAAGAEQPVFGAMQFTAAYEGVSLNCLFREIAERGSSD